MATFDPSLSYARNPDLISTDMDGETVMMSIESGNYFGLGGVGSRVWEALEEPVTLPQAVELVCAEFDVDKTTCERDLRQFFTQLREHDLIQPE
ncbi:MAG: lasso peptide biosynthesis PqqD family chaperone [Gammaproteobacteria bacterium]